MRDTSKTPSVAKLFLAGVAILLFLWLAFANLLGRPVPPRISRARAEMAHIMVALKAYQFETGSYPTPSHGLAALEMNPGVPGWSGPYLRRPPIDPWGTPYVYSTMVTNVDIVSAGPDRTFGTADDI